MKSKTFTVVAVCCCGCDQDEIHWIEATTPERAAKKIEHVGGLPKRIVAVFKGAHSEQRKEP